MKKYILLFAIVFALGSFGLAAKAASVVSSSANSGCLPGNSFSTATGQSCVTPTPVIPTQNSSVVVSSISPTSGAVGTSVVITGSGFTSNNSVNFGGGYINSLSSSNGTTITFTIPNSLGYCPPVFNGVVVACPELSRLVTAGNYNISVTNTNGTSNTVSFTVTGSTLVPPTTTSGPVINGISGPQTLSINTQGTWSVTASDVSNGNLSYSVNWGDTLIANPMNTSAITTVTQQSATFTHSYATAGIYNPTFTVTDASGLSAKASLSVNVGGVTNPVHPCPVSAGSDSTSSTTNCVPITPTPCPVSVNNGSTNDISCAPVTPITPVNPITPEPIIGCTTTSGFNTLTGKPCSVEINTTNGSTSGTQVYKNNPSVCVFSNVMRVGSKGNDVKCLQAYLGITADGFFGNQTKIAIEAWQKKLSLSADGVVGPMSIKALNSSSTTTQ